MPRVKNTRVLLAAGLLGIGLAVAIVLLAIGGEGGGGKSKDGAARPLRAVRAKLTLERFRPPETGVPELLVNLTDTRLNTPDTTGGATSVLLRCVDKSGAEAIRQATPWPLLEEGGYPFPHIHQPALARVLKNVRGCRLTGPGINFEGSVQGPPPVAAQ